MKKITIVLATTNSGKMMDIEEGLKRSQLELKTLNDFHPIPPVVEDGVTFYENAHIESNLYDLVCYFLFLLNTIIKPIRFSLLL